MERRDIQTIRVRFSDRHAGFFDEMINVALSNRKSDSWFIEKDRPMLWPRPWSYGIGNKIITSWSASTSYSIGDIVFLSGKQYKATAANTNSQPPSANWTEVLKWNTDAIFYTDRNRVRRHYRVFDNKLWYLNSNTWTSIKDLQTDNVKLQVQRIPVLFAGGTPTEYTTPSVASAAEKVKKSASDTTPTANIGKVLVITTGVYKGAFAPITDYTSGTTEYTLWGSWIITALAASEKYMIFDTMADCLQVCRGYESNSSYNDDLYFDGITELTHFKWYASNGLRKVLAITATEGIKKSVQFMNRSWSFSGSTLFYSGGLPGNPFFYDFTWALTLGWAGDIIDISVFKNRIIVVGTSFIYALKPDFTFDKLVESFGWLEGGMISTGEDLYILTTQRRLVSLTETISGFIQLKNITQEVDNYVSLFKTNICTWFDGRYMYIYGESGSVGTGILAVFDIQYKFWSIFEGIFPKKIIAEQWLTYFYDNNTDIVRVLSSEYTNDVAIWSETPTNVSQRLTLKEIDLDDIFTKKTISSVFISFENYTQQVTVDLFNAINKRNAKKPPKYLNILSIPQTTASIGSNQIWNNLFGWEENYSDISVPIMAKIDYNSDQANLWKLSITGTNGSFFYISAIDIMIYFATLPKASFDPSSTT